MAPTQARKSPWSGRVQPLEPDPSDPSNSSRPTSTPCPPLTCQLLFSIHPSFPKWVYFPSIMKSRSRSLKQWLSLSVITVWLLPSCDLYFMWLSSLSILKVIWSYNVCDCEIKLGKSTVSYCCFFSTFYRYEKSYMHRDVVTHVAVSAEFFITGSIDGITCCDWNFYFKVRCN